MTADAERREARPAEVDPPNVRSGHRPSIEARRRLVAESMRIGNPRNNARDLPAQSDPKTECPIELKVDDIRLYEHNPRRANNAKFAEIKESIRACGLRNPLTVTRRPGEQHFIVEAGGNTRLLALQQLWAETRELRFEKLMVLFRPWQSESHVLTAHLIENEERSELTYWDKANGIMALKHELEIHKGRHLSLRQLEEELRARGLTLDIASLSRYQFSVDRLGALGEATAGLSGHNAKLIQPRLNLCKRYAQKRAGIAEIELYTLVFERTFQHYSERYGKSRQFDAVAMCQDCEHALAQHLGETTAQLRIYLDALEKFPDLSLDGLDAQIGTTVAAGGAPALPSTGGVADGNTRASAGTGVGRANTPAAVVEAVARANTSREVMEIVGAANTSPAAVESVGAANTPPAAREGVGPANTPPVVRESVGAANTSRAVVEGVGAANTSRAVVEGVGRANTSPAAAVDRASGLIAHKSRTVAGLAQAGLRTALADPQPVDFSERRTSQRDALVRLKDCAVQFAQLTQVEDCLSFCTELPYGYYMETPSSPLDLEPDKPMRHRGWWLLALLCGQMDDTVVRCMPETSRWRRVHGGDVADDAALPLLIENELGGLLQFDSPLASWLLDPTDELSTLFWELVLRVRELKLAPPDDSGNIAARVGASRRP